MKGVAERHAWGGGLELFFLVEHFFEVLSDGAKNGTTLNFIHFSLEEKKHTWKVDLSFEKNNNQNRDINWNIFQIPY